MNDTGIVGVPGRPARLTEPDIRSELPLVGADGNALMIAATVDRGLRLAGADAAYRDAVRTEMLSGDYDHVLAVAAHFTTNGGEGGRA